MWREKQAGNNMETRRENVLKTTFPHPVLGQALQGLFSPSRSLPLLTPRSTVCWPLQGNRVAWPGSHGLLDVLSDVRMNQATGSIRSYALSYSGHMRGTPFSVSLALIVFPQAEGRVPWITVCS